MILTPQTELDAVNIILENDGEAPVNTLDDSGFSESGKAQRVLREVSRTVQSRGWAFNTDRDRKFLPTITDEIVLPTNTLKIKPTYLSEELRLVERGRKLYDVQNNTAVFTSPVYLDIVQMLAFEDLPSTARDYITIRAARVYQARATGSSSQDGFTSQEEVEARSVFKSADRQAHPRGFFRNPRNARLLTRRPL
ncbi:MAG: hypothetical protein MK081_13300 [Flavobacteriales bacterium]|nr:hypothetical protein [Flavobacteriales bacterium]